MIAKHGEAIIWTDLHEESPLRFDSSCYRFFIRNYLRYIQEILECNESIFCSSIMNQMVTDSESRVKEILDIKTKITI